MKKSNDVPLLIHRAALISAFVVGMMWGALLVVSCQSEADTRLQLNLASQHFGMDTQYNERNYGLGIEHDLYMHPGRKTYFMCGGYRNSYEDPTYYGGVGFEWPYGGVDILYINGYENDLLFPVPYLTAGTDKLNLKVYAFPSGNGGAVVGVQFRIGLKLS